MSSTHTIPAGKFKAQCLNLMDEVNENHISIIITKHGKPIAKLTPIEDSPVNFFGCLKNTVTIKKDIIFPIDTDWKANQ